MQDLEQRQPGAAGKAIAAARNFLPLVADPDIVPIGECLRDLIVGLGIPAQKLAKRLIGKDDTEPESIVGAVLLEQLDVPVRTHLLDENGKVETARAAADNGNPQNPYPNPIACLQPSRSDVMLQT